MKTNLFFKKHVLFYNNYKQAFLLVVTLTILLRAECQVIESTISSAHVMLLKTFPINSHTVSSTSVNANALYSNVTTYSGSVFANGGAAVQSGNTITRVVADSLGLISNPPYTVDSYVFSVSNVDPAIVSARPRIRFYANDGTGGGPGTLLSALTFNPISFSASSVQTYNTGPLGANDFTVTTKGIWASITFDNNTGATGATISQLNNLGQGIFNPIDRGVSTDTYFQTTAAGVFGSNPAGADGNFGGAPLANFGWEVISLTALPITLTNFTAQKNGSVNDIMWSTTQEINTNRFEIERSNDGQNFIQIGQVAAAGTSYSILSYQYTDVLPLKGINYYRLRIVDKDNNAKFSEIKSIKNSANTLVSIYPNPVKEIAKLIIDAEKNDKGIITIIDASGKIVYTQSINVFSGENNYRINTSNLSKGFYTIKLKFADQNISQKLIKE